MDHFAAGSVGLFITKKAMAAMCHYIAVVLENMMQNMAAIKLHTVSLVLNGDVIKCNESDVADIVFEILAQILLYYSVFSVDKLLITL